MPYSPSPSCAFARPLLAPISAPTTESHTVIERPAPPRVVERERIIEHHYYERGTVYRERRVYVETPAYAYAPRIYAPEVYNDRPSIYAYAGWRAHFFFPRGPFWHRHRRWW